MTYIAEIINTVEYLNTKYAGDQFVNTVKSHNTNQPNINYIQSHVIGIFLYLPKSIGCVKMSYFIGIWYQGYFK